MREELERSYAFRNTAGEITGYANAVVDANKSRPDEFALELLAATAAALGRAATIAAAQRILLDAVCQTLDTDAAVIASADHAAGLLLIECGCGEWSAAVGATLPLNASLAHQLLAAQQPFVCEDVQRTPLLAGPFAGRTIRVVACAPLVISGRVIGMMAAGRQTKPDAGAMRLLATLADMAASALYRINVLETLEQRVTQRTQDLLEANRRLEQLSQHKDKFLATMSHELRTPLTAVLGLSEALDTGVYGQPNERQQRAIQVILQSGRHLLNLINELLDLSRIEAGYVELQLEPCSLAMVCQSCLTLIGEMVQNKGQQVQFDAPQAIMLLADTRRLHQLLLNLLSNASKFTPDGGEILLSVRGDHTAKTVILEVADSGIGIEPADRERIFEPFIQLDSSLSRRYTGSGLGLALVKHIATLHGGGVEVLNRQTQGSRFVVTLPWREVGT